MFFSFFFFGRSGRRTPEKTKKSANERKDWDYELRNDRRRNPLDDDDVLRAVVCDYVGPAECAVMLKLATLPRSRRGRDLFSSFFIFFRSPHLETHAIEITLDYSTHTHTSKKTEKKNIKIGCVSVTAVFDAKRTLKVRVLKVRWKANIIVTLIEHCLLKRYGLIWKFTDRSMNPWRS